LMKQDYLGWLDEHLTQAKARYEELCRLDDLEEASGGDATVYYVQAQQMFGYVAALEKCQREARDWVEGVVALAKQAERRASSAAPSAKTRSKAGKKKPSKR